MLFGEDEGYRRFNSTVNILETNEGRKNRKSAEQMNIRVERIISGEVYREGNRIVASPIKCKFTVNKKPGRYPRERPGFAIARCDYALPGRRLSIKAGTGERIHHRQEIFFCVRKCRLLARSWRQNFTRRRWRLSGAAD